MSEEIETTKPEMLKWAMILTGASLAVIIWQGMSGIGQLGYTLDGWNLGTSHKRSGEIGLLLALAAAGVLTVIPGIIVVWFVRKHLVKGFALGRVS